MLGELPLEVEEIQAGLGEVSLDAYGEPVLQALVARDLFEPFYAIGPAQTVSSAGEQVGELELRLKLVRDDRKIQGCKLCHVGRRNAPPAHRVGDAHQCLVGGHHVGKSL